MIPYRELANITVPSPAWDKVNDAQLLTDVHSRYTHSNTGAWQEIQSLEVFHNLFTRAWAAKVDSVHGNVNQLPVSIQPQYFFTRTTLSIQIDASSPMETLNATGDSPEHVALRHHLGHIIDCANRTNNVALPIINQPPPLVSTPSVAYQAYEDRIKALAAENDKLRLANLKKDDAIAAKDAEIKDLTTELDETNKSLNQATVKIADLGAELRKAKNTIKEKDEEIRLLWEENDALKRDLDQAERRSDELRGQLTNANADVADLEGRLQQAGQSEEAITALQSQIQHLNKQAHALEEALRKEREEAKVKAQETAQALAKLSAATKEKTESINACRAAYDEIAILRVSNDGLGKEIERLQTTLGIDVKKIPKTIR